MTRPTLRFGLACFGTAIATAGCGGLGSQSSCEPETIEDVAGLTSGRLTVADASSPTDLWFGGTSVSSAGDEVQEKGLVIHWDGTSWSRVDVGHGVEAVYDVAAVAPDDVWAFGPRRPSRDDWLGHWDGTHWSEAQPPGWKLVLPTAIEAVATDDVWLVGTDYGVTGNTTAPYVAHWDGARWSRSDVGVQSGLLEDISAFSADSMWAVGYASLDEYGDSTGTLVLRWDGDKWLKIATPESIDGLDNVTATGHDEAWVVPDYFVSDPSPLWRWDGSTWTQEVAPFHDISVMSAFDGVLWAAGSNSASVGIARLGDHEWEEASMTGVESLDADDPGFSGLVAVSETTAWGVGLEPVASRACVGSG